MTKQKHRPALMAEVLHYLAPGQGDSYFDATAGYGGHAQAILDITDNPAETILVDRDPEAIAELKRQFESQGVRILQGDFLEASEAQLAQKKCFDLILADLGVSSPQLETAERGFSLSRSGPLDMRMDTNQQLSAADIVNTATEAELARIFADYGEEPKARQIAKEIKNRRPIKSTDQLAAIAAKAWPGRSRIHPATRIFQALRIAVNDELGQLEKALPIWLKLLKPGGRIAVISFHSLEDRIVKHFFAEHSASLLEGELKALTKKPIAAKNDEVVFNPRARSARLRAAAKIKTKERI